MAMFQFGGIMCNAVARFAPRTIWRINSQQLVAVSSSAVPNPDPAVLGKSDAPLRQQQSSSKDGQKKIVKNLLVQEAFASILNEKQSPSAPEDVKLSVSKEISSATSVEKLLAIASNREISRQNALSIMSILYDWTNKKKASFSDFERDSRFLQLCEQLAGRSEVFDKFRHHSHGDLATILGLTGDDEAAKLVSTLTLDQMIKVISTLARKRRRSTTILRSLSFNISRTTGKLNIKQSADLLYSMAVLNFPDEVLLQRVSADLIESIPKNDGNAVIGSILSSLGFLRYKNTELLDVLCEWITAKPRSLRPQYITSLLLTLATVAHTPPNSAALHKTIIKPLKETDLPASEIWLEVVWAMVVLGLAEPAHVSSVLDSNFIRKLIDLDHLTVPRKTKLLNIDAMAKLMMPGYKGPFLPEDLKLDDAVMEKSKEKQIFVSSVLDTLANLFPVNSCLNGNVNTGMGFVLDGECYIDSKFNPVPIEQVLKKKKTATRIGVIALDYGDFCRGREEPIGVYSLVIKLLESKGYRIVLVPYTEYSSREKLVTRVKYMEQKIKSTIQPHST